MPRRRKLEETVTPNYQCCFGYMHAQTVTNIICSFFLLSYTVDTITFFTELEHDDWEVFKIIFGFAAATGPLIGSRSRKSTYFFPCFLASIFRMFYYFVIFVSLLYIAPFPLNDLEEKINDLLIEYDSDDLASLITYFPIIPFLLLAIIIIFTFEIWVFYVIYKCFKYISSPSLQNEHKQQPVTIKRGRNKNGKSLSSSNAKPLVKAPTIENDIGYFATLKARFSKYFEKVPPTEVKQPKRNTADKTVEQETVSKSKTQEQMQQLNNVVVTLKPVTCDLTVHLKNPIIQSETVYFTVKSKSVEVVKKEIKQSLSTNLVKCDADIQFRNSRIQSESVEFTVNLKSTEVIEKCIKQPLPEQNPLNSTTSESYSNYNNNSKPKNLVTIEVQTDETSFDQNIVKNQLSKIYSSSSVLDYDSDTYSNSLKPSTPSSSNKYIGDEKSIVTVSSEFSGVSDVEISPYQTFPPNIAIVTFMFKNDETCAVEVYQNGRKKRLKNPFGNEWTPLYFSMANKTPEIGENAQIHYQKFDELREHVLYDIFEVIGKPINEIEINPKWKFKVVENNGIKCFQIKTQDGLRLFPENSIVAAFLKSLKIRAENFLKTEINEIYLSSDFDLTDSQKQVIKSAASKFHLKVLSFDVTDIR